MDSLLNSLMLIREANHLMDSLLNALILIRQSNNLSGSLLNPLKLIRNHGILVSRVHIKNILASYKELMLN